MSFTNRQGRICYNEEWMTKSKTTCRLPQGVVLCIMQWFDLEDTLAINDTFVLSLQTQYNRNDTVFRAHPNYHGDGPWNDWVDVHWEEHDTLPGQLHGFFLCRDDNGEPTVQSIVTSVAFAPTSWGILTMFSKLEMHGNEPLYHVVDGDCLGHHVSMFPGNNEKTRWHQWIPIESWAEQFCEAGKQTH